MSFHLSLPAVSGSDSTNRQKYAFVFFVAMIYYWRELQRLPVIPLILEQNLTFHPLYPPKYFLPVADKIEGIAMTTPSTTVVVDGTPDGILTSEATSIYDDESPLEDRTTRSDQLGQLVVPSTQNGPYHPSAASLDATLNQLGRT